MPSFKKGILYFVLFFIVVWMFVLGVFVGRDSAPVKFDTRKFQKRLANIASEYETEHKSSEETDIQFYEALQKPKSAPEAENLSDQQNSITRSIVASTIEKKNRANTENEESLETKAEPKKKIVLKLSKKSMTKAKQAVSKKEKPASGFGEFAKSVSVPNKKLSGKEKPPKTNIKDQYTIQIAAYRDIAGAVEKISSLKVKGHIAYKTLGKVQTEIWHRVRVGQFPDTETARKYLRELKQDNINGIIIKQE